MTISKILFPLVEEAIEKLFGLSEATIEFQETRKDFEGDITLVIFPLLKKLKGNPVEIGNKIGIYLQENTAEVVSFNVVSGFLNILISDEYYLNFLKSLFKLSTYFKQYSHSSIDLILYTLSVYLTKALASILYKFLIVFFTLI